MDSAGLITRHRDTANRRAHVVELTGAGEEAFLRLRSAAMDFDRRLRAGIGKEELSRFEGVLDRLARNVAADEDPTGWGGLLKVKP